MIKCAARLVAIYLDAFPPTCHQLGLPLTSFGVTAATESNADITSHLNSGGGEDTQLPGVASTVKADDSAATGAAEANVTESAPTPAAVASPQLNAPTTDVDAQDESSDESYINVEDDSSNGGDSYKEAMGIQSVLNVDATLSAMECIEVEELEVGSILVEAPNRTANAVTSVSSSVPVISENTCPQPPRAESFPEGSHLKDTTLPTEQTRTIYSDRTGDEPDMSDSSLQSKADGCGMLREVVKDVEPSRLVPSLSPSAEDVPQGHLDGQLPATPETTPEITSGTSDKPARQCAEGLSKRAASVLGLRAVPGPELLPFFSGTALDSASARGSGSSSSGGRGCGATSGVHGSRVSAISTGLRILVEAGKGRTSEEGAALGGLAERIADGTASQEARMRLDPRRRVHHRFRGQSIRVELLCQRYHYVTGPRPIFECHRFLSFCEHADSGREGCQLPLILRVSCPCLLFRTLISHQFLNPSMLLRNTACIPILHIIRELSSFNTKAILFT